MSPSYDKHRVRIDEVDWAGILSFVHLFRSFRMAIHPAKLFTALFLAALLFLTGQVLDAIFGPVVNQDEIVEYATNSRRDFEAWRATRGRDMLNDLRQRLSDLAYDGLDIESVVNSPDPFTQAIGKVNAHYSKLQDREITEAVNTPDGKKKLNERIETLQQLRRSRTESIRSIAPQGIFSTAMKFEVAAFERLLGGATAMNLGLGELLRGQTHDPSSVVGALREMFVIAPGWLLSAHPVFLAIYAAVGFLLWSLLGGAIARMAALQACRDQRIGPTAAVRFVLSHWLSLIFAPLLLPALVVCIAVTLVLFGLLFFGIPRVHVVLDAIGAVAFFIPILLGLAIALILIGFAPASHLLYPAVAAEGCDAFDANSRALGYVTARPWQLLFYNLLALVYGALTYLFVGAVILLTLAAAQTIVAAGADVFLPRLGARSFDQIIARPAFGRLAYSPDWDALNPAGKLAAVVIKVEVYLFIALLAAYAISFYFCAQTWIYLLLRRSADGSEFDDVYESDASRGPAAALPDKVEPAAAENAER